ncbi:MAG TPA: nucleotidyltransferase family protein [Actinomycetota bacterium]|nr:nucleotidyltransferase family protein [Actinomycetota bacterium]
MSLDSPIRADTPTIQRWLPDVLDRLRIRRVPVLLPCPTQLEDGSSARIDLLVTPTRFPIAMRTLSALGFAEPPGQGPSWPSIDRSIREGITLVRADGVRVDLAHRIRPWVWGDRLPFALLDRRSVTATLDGRATRSVDTSAAVVIATLRSLEGDADGGIRALRALVPACDPGEVARLARSTGLDGVVGAILATLPLRDRPTRLLEVFAGSPPPFADAFRLQRLRAHGRGRRHPLAQVFALPIPNAAAHVAATAVPAPAFLERRLGSRTAYPTWWSQMIVARRTHQGSIGAARTADGPAGMTTAGNGDRAAHRSVAGPRPKRGPTSLFPEVGPVTAATLFHDVPGAPSAPTATDAWDDELAVLLEQRLSGFALAAAARCEAHLSPGTEALLHGAHMRAAARAMAIESTATSALEILASRSIPFVVSKGPGIALSYPQPALRPYGDIDVLVPPDRFSAAMSSLGSLGFEEYFDTGEPRSYFDRYCREGVNLVRADGGSIDLHHRIPPWVWGTRLGFARLLERSHEIELVGGRMRVLDPTHNILVAALHIISDRRDQPGSKLITWRDIVSLAQVCDPEAVVAEAQRLGLDWYLAFILRQLPPSVRPERLTELLGHPHAEPGDAFRLRRLIPPALGSRHQIAQVFRLPIPNAAAFLGGYVVPSRVFLKKRYGQDGGYVRWWREATGRLRDARDAPFDSPWGER